MATRATTSEIKNASNMPADGTRCTDRVEISVPIEVFGTDLKRGRPFRHTGHISVVSRHGAAIVLNYALATDQELTIRCLETNIETEARVLGLISGSTRDLVYGVMFLNTEANPLGIEFPALTGSEGFGRVLLECRTCEIYKVVHLDEIEIQILETNQSIAKFCKACSATTSWKEIARKDSPKLLPADNQRRKAISQPAQVLDRRKHNRMRANVLACIRNGTRFTEEIVTCENLSRSGLCFRTTKSYRKHARIEVAVPFSMGSGNIFVAGRVIQVQDCGEFFRVGVAYAGRRHD